TYGTPGPIVARFPDSDPIMPRRNFRSRAYQLAVDPESAEMMHLSGNRFDASQKTRCGLIGFASFMARSSRTFHHVFTSSSIFVRQSRFVFGLRSGMSARNVSALSPVRLTSIG